MGKMFDMLHEALSDVLEYERGNLKLQSKEIFVPDIPKNYKAKDIKEIREKLKLSQNNLAKWLNVSLNTVQAWEQGTRNPNQASLRLLDIFDRGFPSVEAIYKSKNKTKKNLKKKSKNKISSVSEKPPIRIVAKSQH